MRVDDKISAPRRRGAQVNDLGSANKEAAGALAPSTRSRGLGPLAKRGLRPLGVAWTYLGPGHPGSSKREAIPLSAFDVSKADNSCATKPDSSICC